MRKINFEVFIFLIQKLVYFNNTNIIQLMDKNNNIQFQIHSIKFRRNRNNQNIQYTDHGLKLFPPNLFYTKIYNNFYHLNCIYFNASILSYFNNNLYLVKWNPAHKKYLKFRIEKRYQFSKHLSNINMENHDMFIYPSITKFPSQFLPTVDLTLIKEFILQNSQRQ